MNLTNKTIKRMVVIGGGDAGARFINTIKRSSLNSQFVFIGIFDDNRKKIGKKIEDVEVLDSILNIKKYSNMFDEIVIALPSSSQKRFNDIYNILLKTDKKILTIPSLKNILVKPESITSVRDINIKDLINRKEMPINYQNITNSIKDKTILVTGGAGSIGSVILELCLNGEAKKVVCIDNSEYNTYKLTKKISDERLFYQTADIKDKRLMDIYFNKYKPDIVFHAAALKHVNLQENDIKNCLLTNFFGTKNIIQLSKKYDIKDFVLISTDKAVEPSNNMGLSKRLAELLVLNNSQLSKTNMSIVRFGNVIGSSGSVLNLFSRLIKDRKDIIITNPKVARFFMSIEEACYLVLQSLTIRDNNKQIFMIDMGEEILIKDIAETLIKLNNLKPNEDIKIKFGKLKKGEKISEKLNYTFEKPINTNIDKLIYLDTNIDIEDFKNFQESLEKIIYKNNIDDKKIKLFINEKLINFL
jgi:FlaA1/EpsC-like NDP-sugar epimerase